MMDKALAMLKEAGMNERFWAEVIKEPAYLYNRTISPVLNMKDLQESLIGNGPNNERFKIFVCAAYTFTNEPKSASKCDDLVDLGLYFGMTN